MSGAVDAYRATTDLHLVPGGTAIEGRMMPYGEWAEIDSKAEGHFLERFAPGALSNTIKTRSSRIRALFEHGVSYLAGQPIAVVDEMSDQPDGAYYHATLLDGLPELLVSGLRKGLYGSSIRFRALKFDRNRSPARSAHNPDGIPEVTIREARLHEFSIVTFPAYAGATAHVRSITDEITAREIASNPARMTALVEALDTRTRIQRQPTRDWLAVAEPPTWRL
jgi:HK97 family phage prohead protease